MIAVSGVLAGWLLFKKLFWREVIFIENGPMLIFAAVTFLGGIAVFGLRLAGRFAGAVVLRAAAPRHLQRGTSLPD